MTTLTSRSYNGGVTGGPLCMHTLTAENPLQHLDDWDDFVASRYKEGKSEEEFRVYDAEANPSVAEFYRLNHANQTLDFVLEKEKEFLSLNRSKKSIWEAADYLNTLVDD